MAVAVGFRVGQLELAACDHRFARQRQRIGRSSGAEDDGTNSRVSATSGARSFGTIAATLARIGVARARQRRIAELAHDARAEHERLDLIAVEHERRQVVAGTDAIADPRLAVDRRAGEDQIADVAVDRALRYAEPFGKVRGSRRRAAPPQHVDDLEQPIGSTQSEGLCHQAGCASTRPIAWPSGSSKMPERHAGHDGARHDDASAQALDVGERCGDVGRLDVEGDPLARARIAHANPARNAAAVRLHQSVRRRVASERPAEERAVELTERARILAEHLEPHHRMTHDIEPFDSAADPFRAAPKEISAGS